MAFLRSRHISSAMIKQNDMGTDVDTDERNNEDIIRLIYDGQVNVVVTSQDIEKDIYLGQCKQVIRIGIPQDYLSYVRVKNIPRMSHAQVIILESEDKDNGNSMLRYNTFKQIEGILTTRWPSHQTVPVPDVLSLDLADCSQHGEDGPRFDANDAIALINRYCKAFPSDGFGCAVPRCREKVIKEEDQTRVVSKLYLPRHSPVFWSFKGTATIPRKQSKRPATPEELAKARIESKTRAALLACRALLDVDEMNDQLEPTIRHTNVSLKKADKKCDGEVADGGQGVEGSAKRRRAYHKKFATVLTKNLAVAEESVYMYSITVAVNQPARHEDTVRSYDVPSTDVSSVSLGFLSRNRLPKLPNFTLFSKAGELKISITECLGTTILSHDQLALVKRFHQYVYAHIININGDNEEQCFRFDPEEQSFGCYLVLLIGLSMDPEPSTVKNSGDSMEEVKEGNECDDCLKEIHLQNLTLQSCKERTDDESETQGSSTEELGNTLRANTPDNAHENRAENLTIAFEFLEDLEKQLGDFRNPQHPSVTETRNYEVFRNRVVTATYMAKPTSYFVADICYDMTPLSPFPDPSVAATFAEYYKERYDVVLREDQPLLIMDYISKKQLNLLSSRYQDTKGKDLALPDKNSKRSQRSKIKLIPQLCSIHPISASLWQQMLYIPSIMYRLECLLVAEELRHTIALQTGIGSIEYPGDGLPLLATGESVGENSIEGLFEKNNSERSKKKQAEVPKNRPGTSRKEQTEVPKDYPGASCKEETEVPKDRPEPSRKEQAEVPKDRHGLSRKEQTVVTKNRPGPSATLFLRALTCLGACDVFSHERLEMYGDALIKHSVSLNLYHECPFSNVGQISFLRGLRVSNRQLFYLGRALDLPSYICNVPFKPLVNWHPHGFTALSCDKTQARYLELNATEQGIDLSDNEEEKSEKDEAACVKTGQEALIDGQNHVVVSDKTVADATEAIIGAYLVTCGFNDALRLMKWIGLDVRTKEPQENISYTPTTESTTEYVDEQKTSDFDEEYFDNSLRLSKESLDVEFKEIEEVLGYTFRDKLLLLQAFTHASYPRDFIHVRTSYEHLEFLGDALLDYLITRYLYYTQRTMSPGALTDLRSAVVNSYSFAFLAVKYGFHRHLRSLSPAVFRLVNKFVVVQDDMMKKKMKENPDQVLSLVLS
uniref:Putative dicerA n=1 Tax=Actinia equina TaxID=6106 RepID=A0A2S1PRW1_ACTEQ|nr:putative dicerA [Actinia equina]